MTLESVPRRVVAIVDTSREMLHEASLLFPISHPPVKQFDCVHVLFDDMQNEVLKVDAILVATPNFSHFDIIRAAMEVSFLASRASVARAVGADMRVRPAAHNRSPAHRKTIMHNRRRLPQGRGDAESRQARRLACHLKPKP